MKTTSKTSSLSLLGALIFAPLAFAGPAYPGGFHQVKSSEVRAASNNTSSCCEKHKSKKKECCTVERQQFAQPSGRAPLSREVRDCTALCTMTKAEKRHICAEGEAV